jgi:hypothetical protein
MRAPALLLAAAIGLAGCGGVNYVSPPYYRGSYLPGEHGGGTIPVVVRGNPYRVEDGVLAAAVAAAMQGNTWWPAYFTPTAPDPRNSYHVVVLFAPVAHLPYPDMCSAAEPPLAAPPEEGPVPVSAAFCKWDILLAAASSRLEANGPGDPRFGAVMAGFARALFPIRNPDDASRDDDFFSLF